MNMAFIQFYLQTVIIKNYFGEGGMVFNMTYQFMSSSVIPLFFQIFNFWYFFKNFRRYREFSRGSKSVLTQEQANELFELNEFYIASYYSSFARNVFSVSLYQALIPLSLVFTIFGLTL